MMSAAAPFEVGSYQRLPVRCEVREEELECDGGSKVVWCQSVLVVVHSHIPSSCFSSYVGGASTCRVEKEVRRGLAFGRCFVLSFVCM